MGDSTIEQKLNFENFIFENLNYTVVSKLTFNEYKSYVYLFFSKLNEFKLKGLQKNDVESFVKNHYSNVMSMADENDIIFERRFTSITEELIEFCSDPFFWNTDLHVYMKKWDKLFDSKWFKVADFRG